MNGHTKTMDSDVIKATTQAGLNRAHRYITTVFLAGCQFFVTAYSLLYRHDFVCRYEFCSFILVQS